MQHHITTSFARQDCIYTCELCEAVVSPNPHPEQVVHIEQVVGVHAGVQQHLALQRPDPPVCQLVPLVSLHPHVAHEASHSLQLHWVHESKPACLSSFMILLDNAFPFTKEISFALFTFALRRCKR